MADTLSGLLQLLLMQTGLHSNDWGDKTNVNLQYLEQAIGGTVTPLTTVTGTHDLTDDEARPYGISVTGTLGGNVIYRFPDRFKTYLIGNSAVLGSYTVSVKTVAGAATVVLPAGRWVLVATFASFGCMILELPTSTFSQGLLTQPDAASWRANLVAQVYSPYYAQTNITNSFSLQQNFYSDGQSIAALCNTDNPFQIVLYSAGGARGYIGANSSFPHFVANAGATALWYTDNGGNNYSYGNITAYSDARIKKNIKRIQGALELIDRMRGVTYERKDTGVKRIGLVAQELQEIVPEVVLEGDEGMLTVSYGDLVGLLVEGIKTLHGKMMVQEARIDALERRI
jgi:hypothetical protein